MPCHHKRRFGEEGELAAIDYLQARGYRIIKHHARTPYGEIDIVARKGEGLYFVEVKTRRSDHCGDPFEAISRIKRRRIIQSALWYLGRAESEPMDMHFSVIGIHVKEDGKNQADFLRDAFDTNDIAGFFV